MSKLRAIERAASAESGIDAATLRTDGARDVRRVRQLAWHITRELTNASSISIGRHWGRDHSTVLHGVQIIGSLLSADADLRALRERIVRRVQEGVAVPAPAAPPPEPPAPEPLPPPEPRQDLLYDLSLGEPVLAGGYGTLSRSQLAAQEKRFAQAMREAMS